MDFLRNRTESAIRKELKGIRDSYHHYWDLLAELLQNSRDAINRKRSLGGVGPFFISLEIDSGTNTVTVFDNGVGINASSIHQMLAPGGGDKDDVGSEVGEKGVGLTYAVFSGNNFSIESKVVDADASSGRVVAAQNWLNDLPGSARPIFVESPINSMPASWSPGQADGASNAASYPLESYTRISVGSIVPAESDTSFFSLTRRQIEMLLRSRTAVGVTRRLFNSSAEVEFDFYLTTKLATGNFSSKLDAWYIQPHELVLPNNRVLLDDVRNAFVTKNDAAAKRKYLGSRTVFDTKVVSVDGWDVQVYGVMFPDNDTFRQLSRSSLGLISDESETSEGAELFKSGIFVGTKGMPTGMRIEAKPGGRYPAYYKRCFFFVESPNLKFDLGRKSLHYKYTKRLQEAVYALFGKFEDIATFQGDSRAAPAGSQSTHMQRTQELQADWVSAKGFADLGESSIPYSKIPNNQEAAVAALFHELLGARVLTGYRTLKTGYGARYDAHAICNNSDGETVDAVIEFKHDLESVVNDLQEGKKSFSEINLLIAWDADEQKLRNAGFHLDSIASGFFQGVTHSLSVPIPGIHDIEVILLRTFLDRRKLGS